MSGVSGRSGGHRSGAGEKQSEARVLGLISPKGSSAAVAAPVADMACPEGLPPAVEAIWTELAPHALKARTLVPSTALAFLRLCKALVKHAEMEAQIASDGMTYLKVSIDGAGTEHQEVKAHPLISRAASLESSIKAWMKDFALHPFGKPVLELKSAPMDPFAKFKGGATG